uniref:Uncharacterized protein n=1 Tax=viral metagenome TaxID=1070528 RepID=A0A6H1ZDQ5_9ZZZZ
MEIKLVCLQCRKEMIHDVERTGDDIILEIYPCSRCKKATYEEGWKEGVAKYLNNEVERREENGK